MTAPYLISAGAVDPTFGDNGKTIASVFGGIPQIKDVVLVPDGSTPLDNIVVSSGFFVYEFDAGGSPVSGFGSGGTVNPYPSLAFFPDIRAITGLVADSEQRIVAAIVYGNEANTGFYLTRFDASGQLDPSFGVGGFAPAGPFGPGYASFISLALQSDGSIATAAFIPPASAVSHYHEDGSLDSAFGSGGVALGPLEAGFTVAVQSDGKIVAGGQPSGSLDLRRYAADGTLDAGFGVSGSATAFIGAPGLLKEIVIQPDDKIVAVGDLINSDLSYDLYLVRFNADGTLDSSFGVGGRVRTAIGTDPSAGSGVALQADGKILVSGGFDVLSNNFVGTDFVVRRFNSDGSVDSSFGVNGVATIDLGKTDLAWDLAIQPDGSIVLVGDVWDAAFDRSTSHLALARVSGGGLPDQTLTAGDAFSLRIPANLFTDPEGGALTYAAGLEGGAPLPAWLSFDPATRTLSGTPTTAEILQVSVTATDSESLSASDTLTLSIGAAGGLAGTSIADAIVGSDGSDTVYGFQGDDSVIGGGGDDWIQSNQGEDVIRGRLGNDDLRGGKDSDLLSGGQGNDNLIGGLGDDLIQGRHGNDVLTGGAGNDRFWFNEAGLQTADTITDFTPGEDWIELDSSTLASLVGMVGGSPADGNFLAGVGPAPSNSNQLLLYDTATGDLFYDADGSGAGGALLIATLTGAPALTAGDFLIVA